MSSVPMILLAAPEWIPALRERLGANDEVLTFADSEPLRALETILDKRPDVVVLERLFAATPRGAAIIARIKADPALDACEIRVAAHDTDYCRVSPRRKRDAAAASARPSRPPKPAAPGPLDRGTRRAARFRMPELAVTIDEHAAKLLDLSVIGAQVVSAGALKPGQQVQLHLAPDTEGIRIEGVVVWARLELSKIGPSYRGGIEFTRADRDAVAAYCEANKTA